MDCNWSSGENILASREVLGLLPGRCVVCRFFSYVQLRINPSLLLPCLFRPPAARLLLLPRHTCPAFRQSYLTFLYHFCTIRRRLVFPRIWFTENEKGGSGELPPLTNRSII